MSAAFKRHADLGPLAEPELELVLAEEEFPALHIHEIKAAQPADRNEIYGRAIQLREIRMARNACVDAFNTLSRGAIFLDEITATKFRVFLNLLWDAVVEFQVSQEHKVPPRDDGALERFRRDGVKESQNLEAFMRSRFYPEAQTEPTK